MITGLWVDNKLRGKLISSLEFPYLLQSSYFMIILKLLQFHLFIAPFNLLSCEFDSFTFKLLYWVIFILIKLNLFYNILYNILTVPCEKYKTVSFASSIMKGIVVFVALSKFAVKLIRWIALGSA